MDLFFYNKPTGFWDESQIQGQYALRFQFTSRTLSYVQVP